MDRPPSRDKETQELIRRFQSKRARRRRVNVALACLGGVVVVAVVAAAVLLLTRDPGDQVVSSSSTDTPSRSTTTLAERATTTLGPLTTARSSPAAGSSTTTLSSTTTSSVTTTTLPPTTTSRPPSTTASQPPATTAPRPAGRIVVLDPGHQARGDFNTEPVGPGSGEKKPKVSSGTAGVVTGTPESELVLAVALKLRDSLVSHGIQVVMTRTTQDINISNIQRAQLANDAGADLFVRIHADGSDNSATNGIHTLYPASTKGWTDDIAAASKQAAALIQKELIAATGAKDRGLDARSDMTGFNWSDVPAVLPEIGFMTNPDEDRLLATEAYQNKIVQGLTRAILSFLGVS